MGLFDESWPYKWQLKAQNEEKNVPKPLKYGKSWELRKQVSKK